MNDKEFQYKIIPLKDKIFRFANRLLANSTEAEDVTQDILMKLWSMKQHLDKYNSHEALAIQSTKNLCLDRLKHEKTKKTKLSGLQHSYPFNSVSDYADRYEIREMIQEAINQLPPLQRMIIHLRDVEGYEFSEIESALEMHENAIRVNLSRARTKVKEHLQKIMRYGIK
jgi:RNA polymerase sigma-70 factor (ECF subfamily)